MKINKLTIKRSEWVRGNIGGDSALLNNDGNKCCLGFFALACGVPKKKIQNIGGPDSLIYEYSYSNSNTIYQRLEQLLTKTEVNIIDNPFTTKAIQINDDEKISDKVRENKLKKLFAKNGVELNFVD